MLTADWNSFHAITFCGGNINALYNPQMAIEQPTSDEYKKIISDGARQIKIRPWDDYTRSVDCEIDGEKVTLTISVTQTGGDNNSDDMKSYSLGKLDLFIRFSFENAKNFDKIAKYYRIVKSLIAILTMRNNVFLKYILARETPVISILRREFARFLTITKTILQVNGTM